MLKFATGFDVGATGSRVIATDVNGKPLSDLFEMETDNTKGPHSVLSVLKELNERLLGDLRKRHTGSNGSFNQLAIGLCTPGPADKDGRIGVAGTPNLAGWENFCWKDAFREHFGQQGPVSYLNDGSAGVLGSAIHFKAKNVVGAIVGSGCGGGAIVDGRVVIGRNGRSTEFGHLHIPLNGILLPDQMIPRCGCGNYGDVESFLCLRAIEKNLPAFFGMYALQNKGAKHELAKYPLRDAAKKVRALAEAGDQLALNIFRQQAQVLGRLFVQLGLVFDPELYIIGGGLSATSDSFKEFFKSVVWQQMTLGLGAEQMGYSTVEFAPDDDKAGAIGAALYALQEVGLAV